MGFFSRPQKHSAEDHESLEYITTEKDCTAYVCRRRDLEMAKKVLKRKSVCV